MVVEVSLIKYDKEKINELYNQHIGKTHLNIEGTEGKQRDGKRKFGFKWDLIKLYADKEFLKEYEDVIRAGMLNNIMQDMIKDEFIFEKIKLTAEYLITVLNDDWFIKWRDQGFSNNLRDAWNKLSNDYALTK